MSTHQVIVRCLIGLLVVAALAAPSPGQIHGLLDDIKDEVEDQVEDAATDKGDEDGESKDAATGAGDEVEAEEGLVATNMVFSKSPIDVAEPEDLTTSFAAGDPIYALVRVDKTFQNLAAPDADEPPKKVLVEVKTYVDGTYKASFNVILRNDAAAGRALVLDVAPGPEAMTVFDDPNVEIGKTFDVYDGPIQFTKTLKGLKPGQHTIRVELYRYGVWAEAEFLIEGEDFAVYGELRDKLLDELTKGVTMPTPKRVDPDLEAEMLDALKSANAEVWQNDILRIVIIDADWYLERHEISGIILFRYIRANVAVKDKDGVCWRYDLVTFKQDYVGEEFGPTKFSGVGDRKEIPEENVFPKDGESEDSE